MSAARRGGAVSAVAMAIFLFSLAGLPTGTEGVVTLDAHNACLLYFLALPTLVLGVYWAPVIDLADRSVHFFVG